MFESVYCLAFIGAGGPEILVIMVVLLLMFGSKDAPRILRKINDVINSVRNTADSFKREIMYGDIDRSSASDSIEEDDPAYGMDENDYGYNGDEDDDADDEYLSAEDLERDYSDETFQDLNRDLEEDPAPLSDASTPKTKSASSASEEEEEHV